MQQLPDEILMTIFTYLPAEEIVGCISLVSKYWYQNLCSEMDLKVIQVKSHQIPSLVKCPMLKKLIKLHLIDEIHLDHFTLIGKCEFLENLQVLKGDYMNFASPKVLCSLVFSKFATKLKKIKNEWSSVSYYSFEWAEQILPNIAEITGNPLWYHVLGMCSNKLNGYFKASDLGYIPSLIHLGEKFEDVDVEESFHYYLKAAELGSPKAQYFVGRMYQIGEGVNQDLKEAFQWYLKSANQGRVESIFQVATNYRKGIGIEKSLSKAEEWYRIGALKNHPACQFGLGQILLLNGSSTNCKQAVSFLMKSAEQDCFGAMHTIGKLYEYGIGLDTDLEKAFEQYLKCAKEGKDLESEYLVGKMLIQGKGTKKHFYRGFKYLEKAANRSHRLSCILVGIIYRFGLGVDKDVEQSNELLQSLDLDIDLLIDPTKVESDCTCNLCFNTKIIKGYYHGCENEQCNFEICTDCYESIIDLQCQSCKGNSFKKKNAMYELLPTLNQLLENSEETKPKKRKKKKNENQDGRKLFTEFMNKLTTALQ